MEEVIETIVTENIEVEESTTTLPTLEPEKSKGGNVAKVGFTNNRVHQNEESTMNAPIISQCVFTRIHTSVFKKHKRKWHYSLCKGFL